MDRTTHDQRMLARELHLQRIFLAGLKGDEMAYRTFLSELSTHLRGYLTARLQRQPSDIEDVLQEVLLALHNARHTYREEQPLTAWVFAIARYKLSDFFRIRSRRDELNDPIDELSELFAAPLIEPAQASRDLGKLLKDLPDRQRLPIQHVKLEGLSVLDTARMTGLSESSVKVGIHRGLKALAAMIGVKT